MLGTCEGGVAVKEHLKIAAFAILYVVYAAVCMLLTSIFYGCKAPVQPSDDRAMSDTVLVDAYGPKAHP